MFREGRGGRGELGREGRGGRRELGREGIREGWVKHGGCAF